MNPKMSRAHAAIGDALLMLGRASEARAAYALEPAKDVSLTGMAIVEWKLGNAQAARAAMTKLVADLGERVLYQQGQVLAQWGESAAALAKLEQAHVLGDSGLIYARNDPLLDALRNEPQVRPVACEHRIRPGHIKGETYNENHNDGSRGVTGLDNHDGMREEGERGAG